MFPFEFSGESKGILGTKGLIYQPTTTNKKPMMIFFSFEVVHCKNQNIKHHFLKTKIALCAILSKLWKDPDPVLKIELKTS